MNPNLKIISIAVAVSGLVLMATCATAGGSWQPDPMAALVREGVAHNLEIQVQAQVAASLKDEAAAAGALADPMVGFGLANLPADTFRFDREPMTQKQIFVSQKLPWPGKRDLDAAEVLEKAKRAERVLDQKKFILARKIALRYMDLGLMDRRIELNRQLKGLIDRVLDISKTRYAVGKGLQMDVLQGEIENSRLTEADVTLKRQRRQIENDIHRLVSRKTYQPLPIVPLPLFPHFVLDRHRLTERALAGNPMRNIRLADIALAEARVRLAQKQYYPDFDVKLMYGQRDEDRTGRALTDFVSATVGMPLPIWYRHKQDNRLAAAQKRVAAAQTAVVAIDRDLPFQVDDRIAAVESARRNYRIYEEEILVQAREWVASATSAYEVGKLGFDAMINAHRQLLELQLKQAEHLFDIYRKLAELENIVGGDIPAKQQPTQTPNVGDEK